MGSEESEFLMGHTQGVKDHYLPKDPEHYRKLYAEKAMPNLRFKTPIPLEQDKVIQDYAKKIEALDLKVKAFETFINTAGSIPMLKPDWRKHVTDPAQIEACEWLEFITNFWTGPKGQEIMEQYYNKRMKEKEQK